MLDVEKLLVGRSYALEYPRWDTSPSIQLASAIVATNMMAALEKL